MKDQYGNEMPDDLILLVLIPNSEEQRKAIDNLDWYCFERNRTNHIFVSQKELEKVIGGLTDSEIGYFRRIKSIL